MGLSKAAFKSALVGVIVATALAGCAAQQSSAQPGHVQPSPTMSPTHHALEPSNAVDAQRLQLLTTDPLFSRASLDSSKPEADAATANFNLNRGSAVTVVFGGDPNGTVSVALAHAQLERIRADGWNVVAVECSVNPNFSYARIYATKTIASFTAALTDDIGPGVVTLAAIAPFHTEGSDPWIPDGKTTLAHTCIDGPGAPTETTQSVDTNITGHAQL
jgi:hypothetical protein